MTKMAMKKIDVISKKQHQNGHILTFLSPPPPIVGKDALALSNAQLNL